MNTIIEKEIETKSILLNSKLTERFLKRIDFAIHSFDFIEIAKVVLDFRLTNVPYIDDFINQTRAITRVSDKYETVVKCVTPYLTRSVECNFSKIISGYEIISVVKHSENIRFKTNVALSFDILNGELRNFAWYNVNYSNKTIIQ